MRFCILHKFNFVSLPIFSQFEVLCLQVGNPDKSLNHRALARSYLLSIHEAD